MISIPPFQVLDSVVSGGYFASLRLLRVLRVLRLFKADKYISSSFVLIFDVLYQERNVLVAALYCSFVLWILVSTLLYFLMQGSPFQKQYFDSIPASMWICLLLLTGNGGYEIMEYNTITKVVVGSTAVMALGIFAIPTGIFWSGFLRQFQKRKSLSNSSSNLSQLTRKCKCPNCNFEFEQTETEPGTGQS